MKRHFLFSDFVLKFCIFIFLFSITVNKVHALETPIAGYTSLTGFAWSDTIGWVDMANVLIDPITGKLSGVAWSDNIGWISFDAIYVSGCPLGNLAACSPRLINKLGVDRLWGFAKAQSGESAQAGGWDGYIDLHDILKSGNNLSGHTWGDMVIGWLEMGGVSLVPAAMSGTLTASSPTCIINTNQSTCNVNLTWTTTNPVAVSGITSNRPVADTPIFSNANNGTNQSVTVNGANPNTSYYLYNNSVLLAQVTITPSCATDTSWNASLGKCIDGVNAGITATPNKVSYMSSSTLKWVSTSTNAVTGYQSLGGWAWSENIGWLDMSSLSVDGNTGKISGFAWSENIGWVSFNSADVSGCPNSPCTPYVTTTGLTGFAKAVAGGVAGWDGYIDLSPVTRSGTTLSGYAWGSDVVGWIQMSGAYLVANNAFAPTCTAGWDNSPWSNYPPPVGKNPLNGSGRTSPLDKSSNFTFQCTSSAGDSPISTAHVDVCLAATPILKGGVCNAFDTIAPFTCQYTDNCDVTITNTIPGVPCEVRLQNGTVFSSGVSGMTVTLITEDTYIISCSVVDDNGEKYTDDPITIPYHPHAPTPVVSIKASPATIAIGARTVISWSVLFPGSMQSPPRNCTLSAKPICANGQCNPSQTTAGENINTLLAGNTDTNDPNGARSISTAINHDVTNDFRAVGRKTISLSNSMDFTLNCGPEANASRTVKVYVTNNVEH